MKKLFFTVATIFSALPSLMAQAPQALLRLTLSDGTPLMVTIDNRRYNKHASTLTIGNLPPGRHSVRVYAFSPSDGYGRRGSADLVYSGRVRIQPGTMTSGVVDVNSGAIDWRTEPVEDGYSYGPGPRNGGGNGYNRDNGGGYGDNRSGNDGGGYDPRNDQPVQQVPDNNTDQGNNGGYNNDPDYNSADNTNMPGNNNGGAAVGMGMNQRDFNDLRSRVDNRITDADKIKLLKSVLATKKFNTGQMTEMLSWLNFEDGKLELAEWGVNYVSDRGNYWKLESAFTYQKTKNDFNKFISNNR
ncbi:DUF4476 domain-containing protein [Chitinophagaceae bacterium MMS25-I14]